MTGEKWGKFYVDLNRGKNRVLACCKSCSIKSITYPHLYNMKTRLEEVKQYWRK